MKSPTPGQPLKGSIETPDVDGNEYDHDDFEKDDLVQMAEPNVANRNASIGSKKQAPSTI